MAIPPTSVLSTTTTSASSLSMATSSETQAAPKTSPESTSGQASPSKSLQPEFNALAYCLKNTVVSTGQIYDFHIKARERGIERHVSSPPKSLQATLGRNMEKYDQICDTIEARLNRAIDVLKRDLKREEERVAAEERRKQAESLMLPPPIPPSAIVTMDISSSQAPSEGASTNPRNSPILQPMSGRRQSQVSISSLHRPQFPLKLDLSSTSLRISEEEANALFSKGGLPSPVTLAPKSARPTESNEFPPDFMAAFGNTSLPLDGTSVTTFPDGMHLQQARGLGDSSDKPIELDLDMDMDMSTMTGAFGGTGQAGETHTHSDLFSPINMGDEVGHIQENSRGNQPMKEEGDVLSEFHLDSTNTDDLFGDFSSHDGGLGMALDASVSQTQNAEAPSPNNLMAQLSAVSDLMKSSDSPSNQSAPEFDLGSLDYSQDPSNFFGNSEGPEMGFSMDMDAFLTSQNATNHSESSTSEGPPAMN